MSYCYEYPRPGVTTDAILISNENQNSSILLIQRGIEPFKNDWALPGGFVELDEELEAACARELQEETGITNVPLKQFGTFGGVTRDPRGRTISVVFWAEVSHQLPVTSGDDAQNARWFKLSDLPTLAFDHQQIINQFIDEKKIDLF